MMLVRRLPSSYISPGWRPVQDIFEDLQDPGPIPETGDNAFKLQTRFLLSRGGKHTIQEPRFSPIGNKGRGDR